MATTPDTDRQPPDRHPHDRSARQFSPRLKKIYDELLRMGTLVEEAIHKAVQATAEYDRTLANTVVAEDHRIDDLQHRIENDCVRFIATEQPIAEELRAVFTAVKVVSHLERIGDHARHLSAGVGTIDEVLFDRVRLEIGEMASIGTIMLHDALTACALRDPRLARHAAARDDSIDALNGKAADKMLALMENDPQKTRQGAAMLAIIRVLERLGDEVTNICEWVIYADSAERVELN